MTIAEARHGKAMVNTLFDSFNKMIEPYLVNDRQKQELINAKNAVSNIFDIEINHTLKMLQIEKSIIEKSYRN